MGNLLFSPSGRIGPSEFMKGMIILAVIGAVLGLLTLVSIKLALIGSLISIVLLFPLFCLLIKRSHDAGRSGWMSLAWFVLLIVISIVIGQIVLMIFGGEASKEIEAAMEEALTSGGGASDLLAMTGELAKATAIPSAIASLISTVAGAFVINLLNKSDMDENQYG